MATLNTLFAVINVSDTDAMSERLKSIAPWLHYELQSGEWLIIAPNGTTTQEVSEKVGFVGPGKDTGIVLRIDSYFGRNYQAVWEWMATKQEADLGVATSA